MKLNLHEEIFLLALRDEAGTIAFGAHYNFAVGGAALAQLLMDGKVRFTDDRKPKVSVQDTSSTGDPFLDHWLGRIAARERQRTVQAWVTRIANSRSLKHRVADGLCRKHVLRMEQQKVLLLFTRKVYPEIDPGPERELVERIEAAIFGTGEVDPRTAVLVAIAHRANILRVVIDKDRLARAKDRIEAIASGELAAQATREAIQAMQAAVLITTVVVPGTAR